MVIPTCFFTDEVSPDIEQSCLAGRAAGAQAVELRSAIYGKRIDQLTADELADLAAVLRRHDLATACIASSFGKCELDDDAEWREHQDILCGSIRAAHALGSDVIRVFPFWTPGRRDHPRPGIEAYLDRIAARLGWAVRLAEAEAVTLCFETEAATHSGSCREVRAVLEALGPSPALAVAWDANNAWYADAEEPLQGYERIRGRVRHLHVKPNAAGNIDTVDSSAVSYRQVLAAMLADGYAGAASIEHWGSPEAMLAGIGQLRRLLDDL